MATDEPQPEAGPPPAPPPAPGTPSGYIPPRGVVPDSVGGVYYNTGLVILFTIITLGIFGFFWTYRTNEDLKKYNGDGLGGVLGVVLYFIIQPVLMFTIPNEIKHAYEGDGRESPVSAVWGLWFLLPLIGHIIWYVKVQGALREFWLSKGASPA